MKGRVKTAAIVATLVTLGACDRGAGDEAPKASGFVEATEVRVASRVPGRVEMVGVTEGATVVLGADVVKISPTEIDLALGRLRADRAQAEAQLRLLQAGARPEDIDQARAQVGVTAADEAAAVNDLDSAKADEARFEQLLKNRAGSQKQRDDAVTRRQVAEARLRAATDRSAAAKAALARVQAGARAEEVDAAKARVAAADAQIASLEHDRADVVVKAPANGIVTGRLVEPGELVAAGTPVATIIDLAHAWVNAYVEAALVPALRIDAPVTIVTDAGDRLSGRLSFIAPRAEFTPRNVQTVAERAKLVYRVKVTTDNSAGVLKPGMPVEVEFGPSSK